jgi:hypothetical protein
MFLAGDPLKHLVGIGVLIAMALIARSWPHSTFGLDIYIHGSYRVIPLAGITFWCLLGIALAWLLFFACISIRRHL